MTNAIKVLLLLLIFVVSGCIESRFQLSPESRLPKWFEIPNGMSRDDLTATMTRYTFGDVIFELYDKNRFFNLKEANGVPIDRYPHVPKNAPSSFPLDRAVYVFYTANGVNDIVEYRVPGPLF